MSDKSHQAPHDPNHPSMPEPPGAYPPQSVETGGFGAQAYGQHEAAVPPQQGYPEYGGVGQPYAQQAFLAGGEGPRRPGTVIGGCIMAWVGSAIGLVMGLFFVTITEDSQIFDDYDFGMSRSDAVTMFQLTGAFTIFWCLLVAVMAVFAFRGARWAAIALVVMAGITTVMTLINAFSGGGGGGFAAVAWSVTSAALIYQTQSAKRWFEAKAAERRATRAG